MHFASGSEELSPFRGRDGDSSSERKSRLLIPCRHHDSRLHLGLRLFAIDALWVRISEADWLPSSSSAAELILAQRQEIEQLRTHLTALVRELASLRERIGRRSRNSS